MFPPSRTYISGTGIVPALGWEKCYVLGKESARTGGAYRIRITGDHPRATTTGRASAQPVRTGPAQGQEPLSAIGATAADHPVGTQQTHLRRLAVGRRVLDRAWPIVVHSRP